MLTFKDAMTDFFNHCQYEKNLSAKPLKFYQIDLLQFSAFIKIVSVQTFDITTYPGSIRAQSIQQVNNEIFFRPAVWTFVHV
ncbi:MAG: hypothetical protein V4592_08030 [Bacteroidota bacterium]